MNQSLTRIAEIDLEKALVSLLVIVWIIYLVIEKKTKNIVKVGSMSQDMNFDWKSILKSLSQVMNRTVFWLTCDRLFYFSLWNENYKTSNWIKECYVRKKLNLRGIFDVNSLPESVMMEILPLNFDVQVIWYMLQFTQRPFKKMILNRWSSI